MSAPTLISDCNGAIEHVLFMFSEGLIDNETWLAETLLSLPPAACRVSLVVPAQRRHWAARIVSESGLAGRTRIIETGDPRISAWAQDAFLLRQGYPGGAILPLDGGNLLVGDEIVLIGADMEARWHRDSHETFLTMFRRDVETRRRPIIVRTQAPLRKPWPRRRDVDHRWREDTHPFISTDGTFQPLFHIDMFLTLAGRGPDGRERVLVGDPRLGAELSGIPLPERFPLAAFDDIAELLARHDLNIVRNPLPFVFADDRGKRMRSWFPASSNNCLVQKDATAGDMVWLPTYGRPERRDLVASDEANRQIWRKLGYRVIEAGDFLRLVPRLGSLRCLTKVMSRGRGGGHSKAGGAALSIPAG